MKRKIFISIAYVLAYLLYVGSTFLFNVTKGTNFWIGFAFITIAFIISTITAFNFKSKNSNVFPSSISLLSLTLAYVIITIYLNYKYSVSMIVNNKTIDLYPTSQFIIYEAVCLLIFIIIYIIITINIKHTEIVNNDTSISRSLKDSLVKDVNSMIKGISAYDQNKAITKKLEKLVDDIRFSSINNSIELDISELLERLNIELNNVIEIETDDYSSIDDIISKIERKLI